MGPRTVALGLLRAGDSPRLAEDAEHIHRLAYSEAQFPPIIVHRATMRIIDGHHRFKAALLRGQEEIEVLFFEGDDDTAFLRAVAENTAHGLPLSLPERKAAALRVLATRPDLSDRAIALLTGLTAKTVARLRPCSTGESPHSNAEVRRGLDGRNRPVTVAAGRRRAAELIARDPAAPVREIAKAAGVSVGTAYDVRRRVRDGRDPVPPQQRAAERSTAPVAPVAPVAAEPAAPCPVAAANGPADVGFLLRRLVADPAVRQTDAGRGLLRMLHAHAAGGTDWSAIADSLPPHCAETVIWLARECARRWERLARSLETRTRGVS